MQLSQIVKIYIDFRLFHFQFSASSNCKQLRNNWTLESKDLTHVQGLFEVTSDEVNLDHIETGSSSGSPSHQNSFLTHHPVSVLRLSDYRWSKSLFDAKTNWLRLIPVIKHAEYTKLLNNKLLLYFWGAPKIQNTATTKIDTLFPR